MDNRGWWFPGIGTAEAVLVESPNPKDPAAYIFHNDANLPGPPDWKQNAGTAAFRLGTMYVAGTRTTPAEEQTTRAAEAERRASTAGDSYPVQLARDYVDPLKRYFWNLKAEVDNACTPMTSPAPADIAAGGTADPRLELYNVDDIPAGAAPANEADIRASYRPGLYRFTVYVYRDWDPAETQNYEEREDNKLHVFQFLAAGNQW